MNQAQNPLTASPKQRFMQNAAHVAAHRQIVHSAEFQRGIDYALLEYVSRMARTSDGQQIAATSLKMIGASEFIEVLKTLSESVKIPDVKPQDNLSQNK